MIAKKLEFLGLKLKFDHLFVVDSVGRSGGLIALWMEEFHIGV